MEEGFSPKRKSWGVIDNVQNVVSKKTTVFGATKRGRRTAKWGVTKTKTYKNEDLRPGLRFQTTKTKIL